MLLDRLLSLALCVALVACPSVCRPASCNAKEDSAAAPASCPHCSNGGTRDAEPAGRNDSSPSRAPLQPAESCCEFGNCLCDGALIDDPGVELQLAHVLGLIDVAAEPYAAQLGAPTSHVIALHPPDGDLYSSGRLLRLRFESLLI